MTKRTKPTLGAMLRHDYYAVMMLVLTGASWLGVAIAPLFTLIQGKPPSVESAGPLLGISALMALLITVICLPIFLYRRLRIARVLEHGERVRGKVVANFYSLFRKTPMKPWQGGAMIVYEYEFGGEKHEASHAIWRTETSQSLAEDQAVDILVDPRNPSWALVEKLGERT